MPAPAGSVILFGGHPNSMATRSTLQDGEILVRGGTLRIIRPSPLAITTDNLLHGIIIVPIIVTTLESVIALSPFIGIDSLDWILGAQINEFTLLKCPPALNQLVG